MSDDVPDDPEPRPGQKPLPRAVGPAVSRSTQVATVAVVVVVLLVVGIVLLLQQGRDEPAPAPPDAGQPVTTVPDEPSSGFRPSAESSLAAPPPDVPASLCPSLTIEHPFTVVSFNIHSAIRKNGGLAAGQLIKEIGAWKPDIVLLQEVDNTRARSGNVIQAQQIGEALGMSWIAGSGETGNAVLSRFPVTARKVIALPRAGGRFDRHAVHAVVDVEGTEVSIYSTHFDHMSQGARIAQATALSRVVAADARPTIVGGDLNSRPGSTAVNRLRAAGLGDVWAVGSGSGFTAPAGNPRIRIDFLLYDGFLQPLQSVVLASSVSDHRAVWSRLQLSEKLGCIKVGE